MPLWKVIKRKELREEAQVLTSKWEHHFGIQEDRGTTISVHSFDFAYGDKSEKL